MASEKIIRFAYVPHHRNVHTSDRSKMALSMVSQNHHHITKHAPRGRADRDLFFLARNFSKESNCTVPSCACIVYVCCLTRASKQNTPYLDHRANAKFSHSTCRYQKGNPALRESLFESSVPLDLTPAPTPALSKIESGGVALLSVCYHFKSLSTLSHHDAKITIIVGKAAPTSLSS